MILCASASLRFIFPPALQNRSFWDLLLTVLKDLFAGFRSARRAYRNLIAHRPPGPLADAPAEEIERINQASRIYYDRSEMTSFWVNKPFSESEWAAWILFRFALLVEGLRLIRGIRILDFGCGTGWTSAMLAKFGADVVGVDISPKAIELAEQHAGATLNSEDRKRCKFYTFDGYKLPFPPSTFDAVLIFDALHHLPNPNALLRELARVLGEHGRFGFAEPGLGHSHDHVSQSEIEKGVLEQDLDLERLSDAARGAGFNELEILIQGPHPNTLRLPMKRARWFLKGASWLVPANIIRYSIVKEPIGIFYKGPYTITSLNPILQSAELKCDHRKIEGTPNKPAPIKVSVKNCGDTVWLKESHHGIGYVRLGATLQSADGAILVRDYARTPLSQDVKPGEQLQLEMMLTLPDKPGEYRVLLDMVNEGVCWFSEKGSQPLTLELLVK